MKTLLSGIKPTGRPHIGNYFGAMRQFLDLQDDYKSYIFVADMHALTTLQNGEEMRQNIVDLVLDYLAIGLDPKKVVLFKQSDIPEVAEIAWAFNCITTVPYLQRAHAYKDAVAKDKEINVGVMDYPILMAADILVHDTDIVPVGKDQKQHVEIARDTAEKFNRIFGETFKLPKPLILDQVATVPGTDGQKMSKSYKNTIGLFASDEEIEKAVMSIPTDSKSVEEPKNPDDVHVYNIHKLLLNGEDNAALRKKYTDGGLSYKDAKQMLIEDLKKFISPMREKRAKLTERDAIKVLEKGKKAIRKSIVKKVKDVRQKVGFEL